MSSEQKVQRHHALILQDCDNAPTFKKDIHCPFVPDEVIIRNVSFKLDNNRVGIWKITCNIVNEPLASIYDGCNYCPMNIFPLGKSVNTTWKFEITDLYDRIAFLLDDSDEPIPFDGFLTLSLEFVKYGDK